MKTTALCASILILAPTAALAASAFDGTWGFTPDHIRVSPKPVVFSLSHGDFSCATCADPSTFKADGTEHALKHDPNADSIALTAVDSNNVTAVFKVGGRTVRTMKLVVAKDGKSLEEEDVNLYGTQPTTFEQRYLEQRGGRTARQGGGATRHTARSLTIDGGQGAARPGTCEDPAGHLARTAGLAPRAAGRQLEPG